MKKYLIVLIFVAISYCLRVAPSYHYNHLKVAHFAQPAIHNGQTSPKMLHLAKKEHLQNHYFLTKVSQFHQNIDDQEQNSKSVQNDSSDREQGSNQNIFNELISLTDIKAFTRNSITNLSSLQCACEINKDFLEFEVGCESKAECSQKDFENFEDWEATADYFSEQTLQNFI